MTTAASHSGNNRFSRLAFSFGLKSQPELRNRALDSGKGREVEDWYIPYTGPYEPPPEPRSSRNRDRDSWGDPIYRIGSADASGANPRVHYGGDFGDQQDMRFSEDSRIRMRGRAQSISSHFTTSSGMDHARTTQATQQRHNGSSFHRPPVPSYVSLDTGGVGESPAPNFRQSKDQPLSNRGSLASIFTFGVKSPSSPLHGDRFVKSSPRKRQARPSTSSGADRPIDRLSTDHHRRTASGDSNGHLIRTKYGAKNQLQSIDSHTTTDEDYYNSYYLTLLQTPAKPRFSSSVDPLSASDSPSTLTTSSPSHHPYALTYRQNDTPPGKEGVLIQPKSAPATALTNPSSLAVPKLTFSISHPAQTIGPISVHPTSGPNSVHPTLGPKTVTQKQLKGSVSTPDLKAAKNSLGVPRNGPKGIDRWLSAETWCDALLFPRPRLKLRDEGASKGRIVSPPASPILNSKLQVSSQMESVPSRVLAHSRSLVNLREAKEEEYRREQSQGKDGLASPPTTSQSHSQSQGSTEGTAQMGVNQRQKPPRPKSWASDDLDLPSPAPSLAKVLAEGERLESDRREWQNKAAGSWGNKQARSISRSRSKSLTAKGRKVTNQVQSNINFLAARAVHGNQDVIPILPPIVRHKRAPSSQPGTRSHSSHSRTASNSQAQTSSLVRTLTHSSKSHSRDHSRNDSLSRSAIKVVKSTAAPCCNNDATTTPTDEKNIQQHQRTLEIASQVKEAQGIRPTTSNVLPSAPFAPPLGPSPTPSSTSGVTDSRVGIAISTPLTDESLDRENLRMASHPYAQGGLYSYNVVPIREKRVEYAGPHPVQSLHPTEMPEGPAARHKLPPHVVLSHPYAQAHSPNRDSYDEPLIHHPRPGSDVPAHAKMWAPLTPGIVREILPVDLKYSPFIEGSPKLEGDMAMAMAITNTLGVGEALAYATEYGEKEGESVRDSGLGTSENIHVSGSESRDEEGEAEEFAETITRLGSPSRMPTQYDTTRMTHRLHYQRVQKSPETAHTFASTPLEHQYTPSIPQFIRAEMAALNSSAAMCSETSSQSTSPRPLGSPNDLVGFQDLFYKPGANMDQEPRRMASFGDYSLNGSLTRLSNAPLDLKSPHQRPTSSLTNLARNLSQEFEHLSGRVRSESQYSQSSGSGVIGSPRPMARQPTDASLEFVFEEMPRSNSPSQNENRASSLPFGPQENVPEDVHSMSSMDTGRELEASGDETEIFHVKQVEKVTPEAIDADRRLSFSGQMGYQTERHEAERPRTAPAGTNAAESVNREGQLSVVSSPTSEARVLSGLQAPLSDNTRSSCITTSTLSRMSNLSDFPIPPTSHRLSLISAYFNDINSRPSLSTREDGTSEPLPSQTSNPDTRLTFGAGADAEEIVEALSNHPKQL